MNNSSSTPIASTGDILPSQNDLLDSDETARWLGLKDKHTLEVWRSTGRYPELEYVKVGRLVRYRRSAIEKFLQSRTIGGEAE